MIDPVLASAVKALEEIRSDQGKVCDVYETCVHRACESSYAAWAIADETLRELRGAGLLGDYESPRPMV